ncbi:MAG TPA: hypothetical protein VNS32_22850 [Flavisolibacter sp.]|nr:hypothetical protein [Flavisolibacter sp.]HWJ92915.1 hypothetical protein [Flavisolibacter sp.]
MKKRITRVLNFFAFNLLFFALYLNFIHKDTSNIPTPPPAAVIKGTASVKGTVPVVDPEHYLNKNGEKVNATATFQN